MYLYFVYFTNNTIVDLCDTVIMQELRTFCSETLRLAKKSLFRGLIK